IVEPRGGKGCVAEDGGVSPGGPVDSVLGELAEVVGVDEAKRPIGDHRPPRGTGCTVPPTAPVDELDREPGPDGSPVEADCGTGQGVVGEDEHWAVRVAPVAL